MESAHGQCSKGDACSFRNDDSKRGKKTPSSSLAPRPHTQNDGSKLSKGKSPRGSGPSGRKYQKSVHTSPPRKLYQSFM